MTLRRERPAEVVRPAACLQATMQPGALAANAAMLSRRMRRRTTRADPSSPTSWRRIATRYDRLARNNLAALALVAAIAEWAK